MRHFATIDPSSPRHAAWLEGYGSPTVEIESPTPLECPGRDGLPWPYYRAKVSAIDPTRLHLIAVRIARATGRPTGLVCLDIECGGLPIGAEGVTVTSREEQT